MSGLVYVQAVAGNPKPRDPGFKVWGVRSRWHLPDLQSQGF